MTENKCHLVFAKNGKSFFIVFPNGEESLTCYSKLEGVTCLIEHALAKKISPIDFKELGKEILGAEKLPMGDSLGKIIGAKDGAKLAEQVIAFIEEDEIPEDCNVTENVYFQPCYCGEVHGRLRIGNIITGCIDKKEQALSCLEVYRKIGSITDEEIERVTYEIETFGLS